MPADLILQTHDHFDHSALEKVSNRNERCQIITEKEALINGEHKTFDLPFVKIISVEAGYNKNHDVNKCVGYVLLFNDRIKVYISGDTSMTKQMAEMSKRASTNCRGEHCEPSDRSFCLCYLYNKNININNFIEKPTKLLYSTPIFYNLPQNMEKGVEN